MSTPIKGTALVTGASAGIGAIYADRLARRGFDLILVARNRDRLNALAARITDATGRSVEVVTADLGEPADRARIETILKTDASITLLVNNAGISAPTPTWEVASELTQQLIDVDISALTHLAHAGARAFAARDRGTIVNIASVVALAPEYALNGVYNASKAYVLTLSQSLNLELAGTGVRVQAVLPGATVTDFWDSAGVPLDGVPTEILMNAEDMVDAALAGLDLGEAVTIPALPDTADWDAYERARTALLPNLSRPLPADRYRAVATAS